MHKNIALLLLLLPVLISCHQHRTSTSTATESNLMPLLISEMKTHCIGRYLVDLPSELSVKGAVTVSGVRISSAETDLRQFNANVLLRGEILKLTKSNDEHPFFYKEGVGQSEHTKYFISRRRPAGDPGARKIEAYKWDRGYEIKLEIEAVDFTDPDQTNNSIVKKMVNKNNVPKKTSTVLDLLARIRGRTDGDIPSEPGVCFSGGFISGAAGENEKVWGSYGILSNPDAVFTIRTYSHLKLDTMLLQRGDGIKAELSRFKAKTLRKGDVELPNLAAQEWLLSARTRTDATGHILMLEANPKSGQPQAPMVSLSLKTAIAGKNHENRSEDSSFSDEEVVTVWDAVSRSLRVRPNGF